MKTVYLYQTLTGIKDIAVRILVAMDPIRDSGIDPNWGEYRWVRITEELIEYLLIQLGTGEPFDFKEISEYEELSEHDPDIFDDVSNLIEQYLDYHPKWFHIQGFNIMDMENEWVILEGALLEDPYTCQSRSPLVPSRSPTSEIPLVSPPMDLQSSERVSPIVHWRES